MKPGSRNRLKLIILKSILQLKSSYSRNLPHKLQYSIPADLIIHHTNIQYSIKNIQFPLFLIPFQGSPFIIF